MNSQQNALLQLPWNASDFDAALVDLDGTMVDTLDDFVVALQRMLSDLPAPYKVHTVLRGEVQNMVGKGSEHLVKSLLGSVAQAAGIHVPTDLSPRALELYLKYYGEVNGTHARVYDGVRQGLDQFAAMGWKLACVTNKPTEYAKALLTTLGLGHYFSLVLGGDATARKKPDPMPLLVACERLGVSTQRTLMVGDSSNDAQAARAARCPVVLMTYGYNHGEDVRTADADAFSDSISALRFRS
jgi:phosphoglycolate phosphatase